MAIGSTDEASPKASIKHCRAKESGPWRSGYRGGFVLWRVAAEASTKASATFKQGPPRWGGYVNLKLSPPGSQSEGSALVLVESRTGAVAVASRWHWAWLSRHRLRPA
jgi:hypothetical protein